jgi:RecB family exonuclease
MASPPRVRLFESARARERLDEALEFLRGCAPGTDVLLVGPGREAVDDLVRELTASRGATFGIHRFGLWQLVAHVARSELASAGLAPATVLGTEAVAARAVFDAASRKRIPRLAALVTFPGFPRAVASTLDELRLAGEDAAHVRSAGDGFEELAEIASVAEREMERARIADRSALLRLATWAWRRPHHAALRAAPIVLLDVPVASRRLRELVQALLQGAPRGLALVPAGDVETRRALVACGAAPDPPRRAPSPASPPDALARLRRHLFSPENPPPADADPAVRFLSAPGEARECVEIARDVLAAARRGVRFDEIAVLLRAPELYSAHLLTALRRAGVPFYFARGTRRPDPAGRAFLALLACRAEQLSAKRFAEYLSFAQVPDPDAAGAPPVPSAEPWVSPAEETLAPPRGAAQLGLFGDAETAAPPPARDPEEVAALDGALRAPWKWEEYLVEAAVIGGQDRWRRRLLGFERELSRKSDEIAAEEPESPGIARIRRELVNLGHLERFALPVIDALDALPASAPWGAWLDALAALAPRVLRRPQHVLEVLAEMRPMAAVGPVNVDEVRGVLHERLTSLEEDPPELRFGRVFVATPEAARGRSFRVVFAPGLAERVFPQRPREDPLLPDARRARLAVLAGQAAEEGGRLATQDDRVDEERMRLRLVIGAATERVVLSYPRMDVREARPRVPSFYLLDVWRAVRGVLPDHETLQREAHAAASARLAWPAPPDPADAVDAAEYDLASLSRLLDGRPEETRGRGRWLLEMNDHLARALRTRWKRFNFKQWWPEDGIVRSTEHTAAALAAHAKTARPYSATALERYAACPYRFLLHAVHRLEPREEVAPIVQLDPLTRGSIVHAIQAETLRALAEEDALPVTPASLPRATEVLDETMRRVEEREREELVPAILRVWKDEMARLLADLRIWLRRMAEAPGGWVPEYFELAFGMARPERADPRSVREPVRVEGWQLRGAMDLVERDAAGALRVTDHKTGAARAPEGVVVGGGEVLQPVLYALAAEQLLGAKATGARLWYCTARGGFAERDVPLGDFARLYAREVLGTIGDALETGCFPPAPKPGACAWCDFRPVCGPFEESRARRKDRALLEKLAALREMP